VRRNGIRFSASTAPAAQIAALTQSVTAIPVTKASCTDPTSSGRPSCTAAPTPCITPVLNGGRSSSPRPDW